MRKITIVMTYYDRQFQLNRTLESIAKSKHDNFEVVIVDDQSPELPRVENYGYPIYIMGTRNKNWTNPEPAYNIGIRHALKKNPDVIVLQNAECYHFGDVLEVAERIKQDEYISFSCFSLSKESTFNKKLHLNNIGASEDGQDAWYNHPIHRPVCYDFCSAISTKNLIKLNGYDERLSFGCGYGDDYLLARVRMLGLKVTLTSDPFVVHQWHYNCMVPENKAQLVAKNKALYVELLKENNYRAKHLITPDLCECF